MAGKRSWIFLLIISIIAALYFSIKVALKGTFWVDETIANFFAHTPKSFIPFFKYLTEMGDKIGIVIVALLMLLWLLIFRKNYVGSAALALSLAIGNEVSKFLKDYFVRPRPNLEHLVHVTSYSYPSGHAMVGMIVYFFIAYLLIETINSKAWKWIVGLLAAVLLLLIGASRIILHVHYPSDVLGGYALGFIWVSIWILLYKKFRVRLK